jgi:hypothetical protein
MGSTAWPCMSVSKAIVFPFTTMADAVESSEYVVLSTVTGDPPATRGVLSIAKVGDVLGSAFSLEPPVTMEPC